MASGDIVRLGGTEWLKARENKIMMIEGIALTANQNQFVTILDIVGEGQLLKWLCLQPSVNDFFVKITVDGVQKILLKSGTASGKLFGVICENLLITYNSSSLGAKYKANGQNFDISKGVATYPDISGANPHMFVPQPIYFKNSLKIEMSSTFDVSGIGCEISYILL